MAAKVLMVIDMLNDFIDGNGTLYCGETAREIISFVRKELARFRELGDRIIFLKDAHDWDDREFKRYPRHCVDGTWGNEIIPELLPRPDEKIVKKKTLSAFYETELESILKEIGPAEVEVVGVCTSICVMDAVGELVNRGYDVIVPRQGVADFDEKSHAFALERMQQVYGARII